MRVVVLSMFLVHISHACCHDTPRSSPTSHPPFSSIVLQTTLNMGEDGLKSCDTDVMEEWFGGAERMEALKGFLTKLVQLQVSTLIVTYGMPKLVKILLDRTGFLDSAYGIKGIFGCVRPGILYNKGQALISIYEEMTSEKFADHTEEILFVDDSKSNIDAVDRECNLPEEQNILIDKTTAMTAGNMSGIVEFFQKIADSKPGTSESGADHAISTGASQDDGNSEDPGVPMVASGSSSNSPSRRGSSGR